MCLRIHKSLGPVHSNASSAHEHQPIFEGRDNYLGDTVI
jgi:hypothetical protein